MDPLVLNQPVLNQRNSDSSQTQMYTDKLRLRFSRICDQVKNILNIKKSVLSRVNDDDFLNHFDSFNNAFTLYRTQIQVPRSKQSDLQVFRNVLMNSLIQANLWLVQKYPEKFMDLPHREEFLKIAFFCIEREDEDTSIDVLNFLITLCVIFPASIRNLIPVYLRSFKLGYGHLLRIDAFCQLMRLPTCPFELFLKESLWSIDGREETPSTVVYLSTGYSSLKLWTKIPIFLCRLIELETDPPIQLMCDLIVPAILNFVAVAPSQYLKKARTFSEVAHVEYVRAQFCALKFLFCLAEKKDFGKKDLLVALLALLKNCPHTRDLTHFLNKDRVMPHSKNVHIQMRQELWNSFDELLDPLILDLITDVYTSLDRKYMGMVIDILMAKIYDSTVEIETQSRIFKLLLQFIENYLREKTQFCLVTETATKLLNSISKRLKVFLEFELDILLKNYTLDLQEGFAISHLRPNIYYKRKIKMLSTPKLTLYTECKDFFKQIMFRVFAMTPKNKETAFLEQDEVVYSYSKFLKYSLRVVSVMYAVSSKMKDYVQQEEQLILLTLSGIYAKLHFRVLRKVLLPIVHHLIAELVSCPSSEAVRIFMCSLLNIHSMNSRVLSAMLLEYVILSIDEIYPHGDTTPEELQGIHEKCQAYYNILMDVLRAKPDDKELRCYFVRIVEKCIEMLETSSHKKLCTFYDTVIITLFENVSTDRMESARVIPTIRLQSILLRLNKLHKSSKNVDFQNRILDLCMIVFKNTPKDHNLAVLSLLMVPTVNALRSTPHLAYKAMLNLTEMEAYGDSVLVYHIRPLRKDFMEGLLNTLRIGNNDAKDLALKLLVKYRTLLDDLENQFESENPSESSIQLTSNQWKGTSKVNIPMEKVLESALETVFSHIDGDSSVSSLPHTWVLIHSYMVSNLTVHVEGRCLDLLERFNTHLPNPRFCLCSSRSARETHKTSLKILFAQSKRNSSEFSFVESCVLHYVLVALKQQVACFPEQLEIEGIDPLKCSLEYDSKFIDAFVVVDAIVDLLKSDVNFEGGIDILKLILETSTSAVGLKLIGNFNLVWYYIHSMGRLCYEHASSSNFTGCKMMEVLLQDLCSVPEISQLFPDFVQALLYVIGSTGTENKKILESARNNLEKICSLFLTCIDVKEGPWRGILEVLYHKIWFPTESIRIEVALCLTKIAQYLKMSVFLIPQLFGIRGQLPDSVYIPNLSQLEKLFHSLNLESRAALLEKPKKLRTLKILSGMVSSNCKDLHASPRKIALFEDLILTSIRIFPLMKKDDRKIIINQLRVGLKFPQVAAVAFRCFNMIYCLCKTDCPKLATELFDELFSEINDEVSRLDTQSLWYYIYLFFMFKDYFKMGENMFLLENLQEVRPTLCKIPSQVQLKEILDTLIKSLQCLVPVDKHLNAVSIYERNVHMPIIELLLNEIQVYGVRFHKGHKNHLYELSIPIIHYYPRNALDYFLYKEYNPSDERSFVIFLKYVLFHKDTATFFNYVSDTLLKEHSKYMYCKLPRTLLQHWISRNALNLLYYFCKYRTNFKHVLVQSTELVSKLKSVWFDSDFHYACISPTTHQFMNFREYKQLAYCLFEIFTVVRSTELLFQLMKAPVEHFPENFQFLLNLMNTNFVTKGSVRLFQTLFEGFLRHTDAKEVIVCMNDDSLCKFHCRQVVAVPSITTKFVRKGMYKWELFPEDLQVKIWQFLLIPVFKNALDKESNVEIRDTHVSKIYSMFMPLLVSHRPYDIPEDLIICFVQFSILLLKHTSKLRDDHKDALATFYNTLVNKECSFGQPFRCALRDYGRLLYTSLHVYPLNCSLKDEEIDNVIETWTKVFKETHFPEVAEQALLFMPHVINNFKKMVVHRWMSSMLIVVHELCLKDSATFTDDTEIGPKRLVFDVIKTFILHMIEHYRIAHNTDSLIFPNIKEKTACSDVVEKAINVVFLFLWKKPHLPKFLAEHCYPILVHCLRLCPTLVGKFLLSCIAMLQDSSCTADIISASLRCLYLLLKAETKIVFEIVMAQLMLKFPKDKPSENPIIKLLSSENIEIAELASDLLRVIAMLFQNETLLGLFAWSEKGALMEYFNKVFLPFHNTSLHGMLRPTREVFKTSTPNTTGLRTKVLTSSWQRAPVPLTQYSRTPGPSTTGLRISTPNTRMPGTPGPRSSLLGTPKSRSPLPGTPGPRAPMSDRLGPRVATPGTLRPRAPMPGIPGQRTTVPHTLGQRGPVPGIPRQRAPVRRILRPRVPIPGTPGPRTTVPHMLGQRGPVPGTPGTRTPVPNKAGPQSAVVPKRVQAVEASFPWQDIDNESFHLKCIQFMASTVVKERVYSGSTLPSHTLSAVSVSGNKAAAEVATHDVKNLTIKEVEFQSFLFELNTEEFISALLKQCAMDPSLAEYMWLSLFPVVLGYKKNNTLLLDTIFKNTEFPTVAEKALKSIQNVAVGFEQNFIRGPHFISYLTLESEQKLSQKEQLSDIDIDQVFSCYFNINDDDLVYGLYYNYIPETSVALAYEKVGLFEEARNAYLDVLMSNSVKKFPKYQKFTSDMGYTRCKDKLARWNSISEEKFFDCQVAFDSERLDSSCDCLQVEGADSSVSFRHMYFLLCPWNVRRDMTRPESKISKIVQDIRQFITFKLKKIPSVISPEFMHELQTATRVSEFEKTHDILKRFFDVKDGTERAAIFKKDFSKQSALDDLNVWDDIHGARLRVSSMFLPNCCDIEVENVTPYNDFFMRVASKALLELGDVSLCSKYLKNVKHPFSNWESIELRTEATLQALDSIEDPGDREELLKMAFDHFQRFDSSRNELQARCYAYMGRLKSLAAESTWAEDAFRNLAFNDSSDSLFQKSLELKAFCTTHEWYGDFLEKTFTSTRIEQRPLYLSTAKNAIKQFICTCKYKDKTEAQVPLAKVLGLLLHDEDDALSDVLLQNNSWLPTEYWLPLLPQLLDKPLLPLLDRIGNKYPQAFFFAFTEFRSSKVKPFSKELMKMINKIQEKHSKLLFTIEKIGEELFSLKRIFCDDTLSSIRKIKGSICDMAYECSVESAAIPESLHVQNLLETTLHKGLLVEMTNILQMNENLDRSLVEELEKFSKAVKKDEKSYNVWKLLRKLLVNLTDIVQSWEKSKKYQVKSLYSYSKFLSMFHLYGTEVGMFRNWLAQCEDSVHIARFLPKLEILQRHNMYTCRIYLLGSDGQEYSYLIVPVTRPSRRENRVSQLFTFLNRILSQDKLLPRFSTPSIIPFPDMCLTQDDKGFSSYLYIYTSCHLKMQHNPVVMYYRMVEYYRTLKSKNLKPMQDPSVRCKLFNEIQKLIPKTILKDWVKRICKNSMDYILFRKKFSSEIALVVFAKYCFRLTLQTPDNLLINKRTGVLSSFGLKFNPRPKLKNSQSIISEKGNCTWPPLQLTPNMLEFTNLNGMHGSVVLTMAAIARCFNKNIDGIKAMLNILIFKELEESDRTSDSSSEFDEVCFQETKRHIEEIGRLIEGCAKLGDYTELHTLVSNSLHVNNMSLSNPWIFPWF